MVIYDKNVNSIELEDINNLITEKVPEDKFLEYKSQLDNGEKDKILKTICGFANADGGLFIYGLEEKNGEPQEITGVSLNGKSWDDKKLQIQDWIDRGIEPRLNVEMNMLDLDDDKIVILIKVPKSWNPPHCVKNRKNRIFFVRRDGNTNSMDYEELRRIFDLNNSLIKKVNDFRDERIGKFSSTNKNNYKVLFHSIPLNAFSNNTYSLNKMEQALNNVNYLNNRYKRNFEGIFYEGIEYFFQMFRNGIFEMRYESEDGETLIVLENIIENYANFAENILKVYRELEILCPIVFL